jgi:hypothetical protein
MLSALLPLLLLAPTLPGADPAINAGTQLTFRGSVAEASRDPSAAAKSGKSFDLVVLVSEVDDAGTDFYWLVDERGRGAWPWLERFGHLALDAKLKPIGLRGPSLLYDYGEGKSTIPLISPLFDTDTPLGPDANWQQDGMDYAVEGTKKVEDRDCWQIAVRNNFGPKRTLWLDRNSPLVVRMTEKVFMDKGTEYQLQWQLVGVEPLTEDQFRDTLTGFKSLVALREKLKRPAGTQSEDLTPEQRSLLAAQLPELERAVSAGALGKLVRAASADLRTQAGRVEALAKLGSDYVGKPVEPFSIQGLTQGRLSDADLQGNITVLHFWEYRDEPLKEPYGQVGYLEFIHNRRKGEGVKVYGIAVDSRLQREETRKAALASIRKLRSFMNLTYPIMLDDGAVLKQFGDPRIIGEPLPLYVVVGRDGKVVHYKVGYYEVDRQEGLKELDAILARLVKAK